MTDDIIKELVERIHLELEEIPRVLTRMDGHVPATPAMIYILTVWR